MSCGESHVFRCKGPCLCHPVPPEALLDSHREEYPQANHPRVVLEDLQHLASEATRNDMRLLEYG